MAIGILLAVSDPINMANFAVPISVCKDLVLYQSVQGGKFDRSSGRGLEGP